MKEFRLSVSAFVGRNRFWRQLPLVLATLGVAFALAALDLNRLLTLAQERYGSRGADIFNQWSRLLATSQGKSDPEMLRSVNDFVNRRVQYQDDLSAWGTEDYWATPLESMGRGVGDCEDYAIAKYVTLLQLGMPNEKLRLIYVRARNGGGSAPSVAHMVLGYFEQADSEPLILDNLISSVRPAGSRKDLTPIFSFNSNGLWAGATNDAKGDPTARLSLWRGVLDRMRQDGFSLTHEPTAPSRSTS